MLANHTRTKTAQRYKHVDEGADQEGVSYCCMVLLSLGIFKHVHGHIAMHGVSHDQKRTHVHRLPELRQLTRTIRSSQLGPDQKSTIGDDAEESISQSLFSQVEDPNDDDDDNESKSNNRARPRRLISQDGVSV
jgi:hypothetical protein